MSEYDRAYYAAHREEKAAQKAARRLENLEKARARDKAYRDLPENKAKSAIYYKAHYQANIERERARAREYAATHREECQARIRRRREVQKNAVFTFYGGQPPICSCCGESRLEFLTLDHINGGGTKHREQVGGSGSFMYAWIIKNNFPDGFRILCMNCNFSLGIYGYCPHRGPGALA